MVVMKLVIPLILLIIGGVYLNKGRIVFHGKRYIENQLQKPITRFPTQEKFIVLTFDDDPDPESTEKILNLLNLHGVKASFYVLGENLKKYPELAKKIVVQGHDLENHSWTHEPLIFKSKTFIKSQILKTEYEIKKYQKRELNSFRTPGFEYFYWLTIVLNEQNLCHIKSDFLPTRFDENSVEAFKESLSPGMIVLLHGNSQEPGAFDYFSKIISIAKDQGYKFLTVQQALDATKSKVGCYGN